MKTKIEGREEFNFKPLLPFMEAVHKREITLMDKLLALWNKTSRTEPKRFRTEFVEFAVENGYTRKWAGEVACDAGFRFRKPGGGRKPSADKDADKNADKVTKAMAYIAKLDLTKAEISKLVKQLAK